MVAPPSGFEGASLRFDGKDQNQEKSRANTFAQIYKTPNAEGHRIELTLSAKPGKTVTISSDGWDTSSGSQLVLLDPNSGRKYKLSSGEEAKITPENENTSLLLLMGDTSFIKEQQDEFLPEQIDIKPNYPNPFNPSTTLRFELPEQTEVRLQVFNVLGQRVRTLINNEVREAGVHTITFDGSRQASGMYFAVFEVGDRRFVQKMMLIK
ncbi:MAG: T9SS type A sorting domain-containing protein [Fodinibius sp.]|nr:T9SS type A sorting domain-containing protein [Fodinibius sp.]